MKFYPAKPTVNPAETNTNTVSASTEAVLSATPVEGDDSNNHEVQTNRIIEQSASGAPSHTEPPMKKKKKHALAKKIALGIGLFLVLILAALGAIGFHVYRTAMELQAQAQSLAVLATATSDAFKSQNLPAVSSNIAEMKTGLAQMEQTYNRLSYLGKIPVISSYFSDGQKVFLAGNAALAAGEKTVGAITPYADVLGFSGEGSFDGGNAEDRVKLILQTLSAIEPQLDGIAADLQVANAALSQIDPNRYPEQIRGRQIRSNIITLQSTVKGADEALNQYRPVLLRLPSIAGALEGARRKYLVLFQNDNELRPTGGFLTAYAIINVENGKIDAEKSDDIYELDKKFTKKESIPPKLGKYLTTESKFNLRDMNISPDFWISMDQFAQNYKTIKGEPQNIDGIIAVDTKILTDILKIIGPVTVPGYGQFSAEITEECDCPQIIYALSQIITRPTPYIREDRKGVLGPLMKEVLTRTYGSGKTQLPQIVQSGFENMQARHLQMYFFNEEDQKAAELIGAAGRMVPPEENHDFLAIINANLAGAKSNLFITYDVLQTIPVPEGGYIEKTVEITYKNPRAGDNCNLEAGLLCLNSTNNDWTRLYVPINSTLVSAQGFKADLETYEENGFTVFDGFHTLQPNSTTKLVVTYRVPYTDSQQYRLTQWKQAGVEEFNMIVDVNGDQQQMTVTKDTEVVADF